MAKPKKLSLVEQGRGWLTKSWVQWILVTIILFLLSWALMGSAINSCPTNTTAFDSDSTGGFAWMQWATGNGLSWGHTDRSYYPFGENLNVPQYITSTLFLYPYRVFSTLTTPICGLNLMVLLGYMSCGLLMFGLIKWLLKRGDIAFFAALAAAFVPFHILKSYSHVNYMYSSIFIALIWAYLWFMKNPGYKKALVLAIVSSLGFYFDGYFVLISGVLIAALFSSSFVFDGLKALIRWSTDDIDKDKLKVRLKYLLATLGILFVLLLPILRIEIVSGKAISQSLSTVRSSIISETVTYGARPIEFLLPAYNSAIMPHSYAAWRNRHEHGSNSSESTLYLGYTVMVLAIVSLIYLKRLNYRRLKFQNIPYTLIVFTLVFGFLACFALSLPSTAYIFGHNVPMPSDLLIKLSSNWRVLSRLFLAMDPLVVILASLGLYLLTKNLRCSLQLLIVAACTLILLLEYLPSPLHSAGNIYKNAPQVYKDIAKDKSVKVVAIYPLASFADTPGIFTFQPIYGKTLVNANDGDNSEGPFDTSIAGLNDPQTLGVLKALDVGVLVTLGFQPSNTGLSSAYSLNPAHNPNGTINIANSYYAYTINSSVAPHSYALVTESGFVDPLVGSNQMSHRIIVSQGTMKVVNLSPAPSLNNNRVSFSVASRCVAKALVVVSQNGHTLWSGYVGNTPSPIDLTVGGGLFNVTTSYCNVDVTNLDASN